MAKSSIIVFAICVFFLKVNGKEIDHWGTHFIMAFMDTLNNTAAKNIVVITAREPTQVKVVFHPTSREDFYNIPAYGSQQLEFTTLSFAASFGQVIEDRAVSVEASAKVSVYAYSYLNEFSDGFLVLPVASLGTEYLTVSSGFFPQIIIAASDDDTEVTVYYKVPPLGSKCLEVHLNQYFPDSNTPHNFKMDAYDVINICCMYDTSGTIITSTKPVAVITGSESLGLGNIHIRSAAVEMLPPTINFGTQFALIAPHGHSSGRALLRIISKKFWSSSNGYSANSRETRDIPVVQGTKICFNTTEPVLVLIFIEGDKFSTNFIGNSFMMVIPPVTKFSTEYVIPTDVLNTYNAFTNQVDVVADLPFTVPMVPGLSYYSLCSKYSYNSSFEPLNGILHYKGEPSYLVLMYGYATRDGYGFPAGMGLTDFTGADECSSSPCLNGGWCLETGSSFECYCHNSRYEGDFCEIDTVDDCDSDPCGLHGYCYDHNGYYTCVCDDGYTDINCTMYITTTAESTTTELTTQKLTTQEPTTQEPTTQKLTTQESKTTELTTQEPTTAEPTTQEPTTTTTTTTTELTTQESITTEPTRQEPTTAEPTTQEPTTTTELTTQESITTDPTTQEPTTIEPTTQEQTTIGPTTHEQTTTESTTQESTTIEPTTQEPTTEPTTHELTTESTTQKPTTAEPTTQKPTIAEPTTEESKTTEPTTQEPTSKEPTTQEPTTTEPTTREQSTSEQTTRELTTTDHTTELKTTEVSTHKSTTGKLKLELTTTSPTTPESTALNELSTSRPSTLDPTTEEPTSKSESTSTQQTTPEPTTKEITIFNRIYLQKKYCTDYLCMCKCPCVKKMTSIQIKNYTLLRQNSLKIEKVTLSKTIRTKISVENLTQSETNLGITSTVFVSGVFFTIILMDVSRVFAWISSKYLKVKTRLIHVRPAS